VTLSRSRQTRGPRRAVREAARAARAVKLRCEGLTLDQIATKLGYSNRSSAFKAIERSLRENTAENVEQLRQVEGRRLDELEAVYRPKAMRGDLDAAKLLVAVGDRRAKLFGLNAPVKTEITGADGGAVEVKVSDSELAAQARAAMAQLMGEKALPKTDTLSMTDANAGGERDPA
jgi:hypothetical protein